MSSIVGALDTFVYVGVQNALKICTEVLLSTAAIHIKKENHDPIRSMVRQVIPTSYDTMKQALGYPGGHLFCIVSYRQSLIVTVSMSCPENDLRTLSASLDAFGYIIESTRVYGSCSAKAHEVRDL